MPKKDYQKKQLKNPYFKKEKNKRRKKNFFLIFIILVFIAFLCYLLFFSSIFTIKNIKIIGTERTENHLIEDLVWQLSQERRVFDIKGDNLFLFSKNKLEDEMYLRLDLANITIKKKLLNNLIIEVLEREAVFILKNKHNYQFRDISACPIHVLEVNENDLKNHPILENNNLNENELKTCMNIDNTYIYDLLELYNLVKKSYNFSIDRFIVNSEKYNLNMILNEGAIVYFSRREDFRKQLEKLRLIFQETELDDQLSNINYIDVRYGDKAFINYK